jgi:creatinine amidohydrolase
MKPILLLEQSHRRARALLGTGAPVHVLVNPTEYHGPHLPLDVDRLISTGVATRMHEALLTRTGENWPFLIGANLNLGVDAVSGPGSCETSFRELRRAVTQVCNSLADLGATKVIFGTWHGGPMHGHALQAGADYLHARGVEAVVPFHGLTQRMVSGQDLEAFHTIAASLPSAADRELVCAHPDLDTHGGFLETSLALALAPDSVDPFYDELPDCPPWPQDPHLARLGRIAARLGFASLAKELRFVADMSLWNEVRPFPGYTGRPRLARAEVGEAFIEEILPHFVEAAVASFAGDRSLRPPLQFLRWVSLDGRWNPISRIDMQDIAAL